MNKLSYYGAIDQNIRKFRQVSHALSFLCMKTTFPHCKMKSLSARKCVKLTKSLGWDPKRTWREYPDKWQLRPEYAKDPLAMSYVPVYGIKTNICLRFSHIRYYTSLGIPRVKLRYRD